MRTSCLLLLIGSVLLATACGGTTPAPAAPSAEAPAVEAAQPLKKPGEAHVGERTTCVVSGHEFDVTAESPKVDHEGKTYYFCCPGCDEKFQQDPAKYLGGSGS